MNYTLNSYKIIDFNLFELQKLTKQYSIFLMRKNSMTGASTRGPKGEKVGTINEDQLKEIASKKMPDLNTDNIEIAMRVRSCLMFMV